MTEQQNPAQGGVQSPASSVVVAAPTFDMNIETPHQFLQRDSFSAAELMRQEFPEMEQVVPGIIACGLVLLAAAPKIGKSWFSLALAYDVATGGRAFGAIPVKARPVLYLALEDGALRLQQRFKMMGCNMDSMPDDLWLKLRYRGNEDPVSNLKSFLNKYGKRKPLVIIDTLGKVMPYFVSQGRETSFEHDYRMMSAFKEVVDRHEGSTLLIVHHERKDKSSDFMDSVSGTNAITGAADTILRLSRERRSAEGTLEVTSRDNREGEYGMAFDVEHGLWTLQGRTIEESEQLAYQRELTDGCGDLMTAVVNFVVSRSKPVTAADISREIGVDQKLVGTYLGRACDSKRIQRVTRGIYAALGYKRVETVENVENDGKLKKGEYVPWDCDLSADSTYSTLSGDTQKTPQKGRSSLPTEKVSGGGYS